MSTPNEPAQHTRERDPESPEEMARQMLRDRLTTKAMGGLFPELTNFDFSQVQTVLDIASGPGAWALDVACAYPEVKVVGIDISQAVVNYANGQASAQGLSNVSFQVMNALEPLHFSDNSFDIVNARFLLGFVSTEVWPKLVQECARITRPGGIMRLTEFEWSITNGAASERLAEMCVRALKLSGKSYSPDGRHLGITPMLGHLLRKAGYQNIRYMAHGDEFSAGTEASERQSQNHMNGYQLFRPTLVKLGLTTEVEFDRLYQQFLGELFSDDFCGISFFLTVWGMKPA